MDELKTAVAGLVQDNCPKPLRAVLNAWMVGKATKDELLDASFIAQLDMLDEYRCFSRPTIPQAVSDFWKLSPYDRKKIDESLKEKLLLDNSDFFKQESAIRARNFANSETLKELLGWCESKGMPSTAIYQVKNAMNRHKPTVDASHPSVKAVRAVFGDSE